MLSRCGYLAGTHVNTSCVIAFLLRKRVFKSMTWPMSLLQHRAHVLRNPPSELHRPRRRGL
eukprot:7168959-Pyramimonas_sp.AAC.1